MSDILSCKPSELPKLFPGVPLDELRKMRKRAQNARWQKTYRADGRDKCKPDTRPIKTCSEERRLRENAIEGSQQLLRAILEART